MAFSILAHFLQMNGKRVGMRMRYEMNTKTFAMNKKKTPDDYEEEFENRFWSTDAEYSVQNFWLNFMKN